MHDSKILERESLRLELLFLEQRAELIRKRLIELDVFELHEIVEKPWSPPYRPKFDSPFDSFKLENDFCSKCGLDLTKPTGYVCVDLFCLCGFGPAVALNTGCENVK